MAKYNIFGQIGPNPPIYSESTSPMTTDSALRELLVDFIKEERDRSKLFTNKYMREQELRVAVRLESILTAAGEAQLGDHDCYVFHPNACDQDQVFALARGGATVVLQSKVSASKQSAAPAGMVLVPRKVTEAMNDAYNDVPSGFAGSPPASQWVWDAMLAAAPAAQVADEGALEHWDSIISDAEEIASNSRDERIKYRAERVAGYLRSHKPGAAPAAVVDEAMVLRALRGVWPLREYTEYQRNFMHTARAAEGKG